ncbi:hypothetical protein OIU77_020956 [Salix suchowensis]|uniref:V-type proton ATPase subunit a n=1 Tax=Salix suchowensis TaxID=1278906 RepID=A0ABQ9CBE4_9ROSI|nr:hypothetical protein OIU77_020956 [Salix suchowensis]
MAEARAAGGGCCPPMDLFRSEAMQLVQLIIPIESAHHTVSYIGDLGLLQFKDLNADKSPFQRTYAAQIKKFGEMSRKLRFFKEQMEKAGVTPLTKPMKQAEIDVDDLEVKLGELEAELLVLNKAGEFFSSAFSRATAQQKEIESQQTGEESLDTPLLEDKKKSMLFERIIFRATRGNVYTRQVAVEEPVIDPVSGEKVEKNVFVVFYSGEKAKTKILKSL